MKIKEIEKLLFGPEIRTEDQYLVNKAWFQVNGERIDLLNEFQKSHLKYLNKRERRIVCKVVQDRIKEMQLRSLINVKGKYENFESWKGTGQLIYRGKSLGWEMNYDLNNGSSDIQNFDTKKEARKALKEAFNKTIY